MKFEKKTKLIQLFSGNEFLSYKKIIDNLNISRNAVLKQIKSLKELGYHIEFDKNKGYRLISKPDKIIPEEITNELDTDIIGKDVYYFKSISSTNIYARKIAEKGFREGVVVIADTQTKGRGRKNRFWFSSFGGLWFSVVLRPNILPERGMFVTMVASIAVAQTIKKITNIDPVIKWPNDLLINRKKVCGILTEIDIKNDKINYAIVGIGINLNNIISKEIEKIGTSISIEFGSDISRIEFLKIILKYFDNNYKILIKDDFNKIKKLWTNYNNIIGEKVKIKDNGNIKTGIILGIDENGYLILKNIDGISKIFNGDIIYL